MPSVLEPAVLCGLPLRNRFVLSATWDALADAEGAVTDSSAKLYDDLAAGGVGLIVTGYAFVSAHGQAAVNQYGIHRDDLIPGLRRLVEAAHRHGAKIAVQIVHAGRGSAFLARQGQVLLAPSQIGENPPHRAMTDEEIESIIDDFAAAARRAKEAGFDAVQLHGAHGYLMSQFLSPLTNQRQDRWGGSPENRCRFHVETVRRVKAALGPEVPLLIKFGIADDAEGGASLEEGLAALSAMVEAGLDGVEISGGIARGQRSASRVFEGTSEEPYYADRAAAAKKAVDIPVILVGGIRTLDTAERLVSSGNADFISLSRPLIREPGLINRWSSGSQEAAKCISCNKCLGIVGRGEPLECGQERAIREGRL
jgi:2,4-dienoyl-CoA reductase-like NADH-dependent reductase (Old Yellow Enzyme family)